MHGQPEALDRDSRQAGLRDRLLLFDLATPEPPMQIGTGLAGHFTPTSISASDRSVKPSISPSSTSAATLIAVHSTCQPGYPAPHGLSHFMMLVSNKVVDIAAAYDCGAKVRVRA